MMTNEQPCHWCGRPPKRNPEDQRGCSRAGIEHDHSPVRGDYVVSPSRRGNVTHRTATQVWIDCEGPYPLADVKLVALTWHCKTCGHSEAIERTAGCRPREARTCAACAEGGDTMAALEFVEIVA